MSNDTLVPILVALIGALGLVLVAVIPLLVSTRRHAKETNHAVNNKPKHEPTIADEVSQINRAMKRLTAEVHEVRKEQAAVAVALGKHLADGD